MGTWKKLLSENSTGEIVVTNADATIEPAGDITFDLVADSNDIKITQNDGGTWNPTSSASIATKAYVDANSGATNLGIVATNTGLTVTSDTGDDAVLPAANTSTWGVLSDDDWNTFDGKQDALTFGISDTNIPIFTAGVADDDFLKVSGTSIEGRSAAEVLSDIGAQASLTFGIANGNSLKVDEPDGGYTASSGDIAQFTSTGIKGVNHVTAIGKDEDDMASDSDTHFPTQQSVKAYVDAHPTDLGVENTGTGLLISSSTGTNVALPVATTSTWGVMNTVLFDKLDDITYGIADDNVVQIDSADVAAVSYTHLRAHET